MGCELGCSHKAGHSHAGGGGSEVIDCHGNDGLPLPGSLVCACVCVCICMCVYVYVYVCVHVCVYTL